MYGFTVKFSFLLSYILYVYHLNVDINKKYNWEVIINMKNLMIKLIELNAKLNLILQTDEISSESGASNTVNMCLNVLDEYSDTIDAIFKLGELSEKEYNAINDLSKEDDELFAKEIDRSKVLLIQLAGVMSI